jgi:hypothetical protein
MGFLSRSPPVGGAPKSIAPFDLELQVLLQDHDQGLRVIGIKGGGIPQLTGRRVLDPDLRHPVVPIELVGDREERFIDEGEASLAPGLHVIHFRSLRRRHVTIVCDAGFLAGRQAHRFRFRATCRRHGRNQLLKERAIA